MAAGAAINNYAFHDISNLNRTLDHVLEWDKKTPNPFRDKTRSEGDDKELEQVYSGFRDLKAKLVTEKDDLEHKARVAAPQMQAMIAEFDNRCRESAQQSAPRDAPRATRP